MIRKSLPCIFAAGLIALSCGKKEDRVEVENPKTKEEVAKLQKQNKELSDEIAKAKSAPKPLDTTAQTAADKKALEEKNKLIAQLEADKKAAQDALAKSNQTFVSNIENTKNERVLTDFIAGIKSADLAKAEEILAKNPSDKRSAAEVHLATRKDQATTHAESTSVTLKNTKAEFVKSETALKSAQANLTKLNTEVSEIATKTQPELQKQLQDKTTAFNKTGETLSLAKKQLAATEVELKKQQAAHQTSVDNHAAFIKVHNELNAKHTELTALIDSTPADKPELKKPLIEKILPIASDMKEAQERIAAVIPVIKQQKTIVDASVKKLEAAKVAHLKATEDNAKATKAHVEVTQQVAALVGKDGKGGRLAELNGQIKNISETITATLQPAFSKAVTSTKNAEVAHAEATRVNTEITTLHTTFQKIRSAKN